ncbi:MAG: replication-associated recombination protein A [Deltaproteobacteria bacterium]|nr:replication-associated recombination protein A [Deltaproteobacteria bacterium]
MKTQVPLAERMRPQNLSEFFGQTHLVGEGKILHKLLSQDKLFSLVFWGPPGSGKTTLAHIIAHSTQSLFAPLSAVTSGKKDLQKIFEEAKAKMDSLCQGNDRKKTILFVDEIHRFSKTQQDALLPYVETGIVTFIGATTENPSFRIISPLLSRSRVLVLKKLDEKQLRNIALQALQSEKGLHNKFKLEEKALTYLSSICDGDSRILLNTLEVASTLCTQNTITLEDVSEAIQKKALFYDKNAEEHYNIISAFIKSLRGSNPHAALYWLARMIEGGEDPLFIARRLVIFASEDIGNADPLALQVATSSLHAVQFVGLPECKLTLAQAVTYLSSAPKSNASYTAILEAIKDVEKYGALPVPLHIRNAPTQLMKDLDYGKGYQYPHDHKNGKASQEYLPEKLKGKKYYHPKNIGFEKNIIERLKFWEKE